MEVVLIKKTVIRNVVVFKIWFINAKQNYICPVPPPKCKTCFYGIVNIVNSF